MNWILYCLAGALSVYVIINIVLSRKLSNGDAIALLGIVIAIILALNTSVGPPPTLTSTPTIPTHVVATNTILHETLTPTPTLIIPSLITATNTLPPAIAQTILVGLSGEDGYVISTGVTNPNPNVGDNNSNEAVQAFVSFDLSSIPASATIVKVVVDFSGYDVLGNPWSLGDGCLRAYSQNYGSVDASDYFPGGDPTGAYIRWCGAAELSSASEVADMKTLVQSLIGSSRIQLRLQFKSPNPSANGTADMVRFGTIKLIITYQ